MKVTVDKALIEQAIDVINSECGYGGSNSYEPRTIVEALRAALAEPAVEHVAYVNNEGFIIERDDVLIAPGMKLYTSPPPADVPMISQAEREATVAEAERLYSLDTTGSWRKVNTWQPKPLYAERQD